MPSNKTKGKEKEVIFFENLQYRLQYFIHASNQWRTLASLLSEMKTETPQRLSDFPKGTHLRSHALNNSSKGCPISKPVPLYISLGKQRLEGAR
jgi:hypothetical protein